VDEKRVNEGLDYESSKNRVIQFLESKHVVVLATSLSDQVTARTVTFATDGLDILFMSWGHHQKCVQIRGNPRVAVCRDNVQIEGEAEVLGSPLDEKKGTPRYTGRSFHAITRRSPTCRAWCWSG
jgi:hypothetical protein